MLVRCGPRPRVSDGGGEGAAAEVAAWLLGSGAVRAVAARHLLALGEPCSPLWAGSSAAGVATSCRGSSGIRWWSRLLASRSPCCSPWGPRSSSNTGSPIARRFDGSRRTAGTIARRSRSTDHRQQRRHHQLAEGRQQVEGEATDRCMGFAVCRVGRTRGGGLSDRDHALKGSPATDLATADEGGTKQTGTWAAFVQLRRHFVGADEGPRTPNLPITSAAPTVRGGPSYSC